jgi:hypothetical protein
MKQLILASLFVSQFAHAGCNIVVSSNLTSERDIGPITNLVKDKRMIGNWGYCTVKFDITVDGKIYHLTETEKGLEQEEALCYYARERARKNLLMDLPGRFKTETKTTCKETNLVNR